MQNEWKTEKAKQMVENLLYEMDQTIFFLNICLHNDLCAPWELHPMLVQEYEAGKQAVWAATRG